MTYPRWVLLCHWFFCCGHKFCLCLFYYEILGSANNRQNEANFTTKISIRKVIQHNIFCEWSKRIFGNAVENNNNLTFASTSKT